MGWAEGLNAGINLGNVIKQGMLQQDLADEAKKYRATEGAYGPELSSNIEQLRGLQQQNPEMAAQYEPAIAELQRRQGLTAPDYSVNSGSQNYANLSDAQNATMQRRTAGLADVYRNYGDIDKANELESRALQQRAASAQVKGLERTEQEAARLQSFETDFNQLENKSDLDAVKSLAAKHNLSRAQQFTVASQMSGIEKAELEMMDNYIKKATKGKDLDGLLDLHKNDKKFADGTHFVKAVGKDGQVILNLVTDADPTKVLRTESFKNSDLATAYLRKQAEDPANVAEWTLGVRKAEAQISAAEASAVKDRAIGGLYASGGASSAKSLKAQVANFKEVFGRDPTEKEKAQMAGLVTKDSSKPEFNPKDYAASIKSFTDAGLSLPAATIRADELYGRIAPTASEDEALAALNAKKSGVTAPALQPPAPALAEKRYIREKTNRGGYTYTVSPRGLTRAEYAEIDRNK